MTRNLNIIIFIIFFLSAISNVNGHERIANSPCNIFIDKVIENYDQIKDHYYVSYNEPKYGFIIENTWDPNAIEEWEDGSRTIGKSKFKRDVKGNIFIQNVYPSYVTKVNFKPGDKIVKINDIDLKNYDDDKINEIFDNKDTKTKITYIDKQNNLITEALKTYDETTILKYLRFKLNNFNSINNQTFETDFLIEYEVGVEMYDGIKKNDYVDMDNDQLFKLVKNTFYNVDADGTEWYGGCDYTNDELNQMQLYSPGWDLKLLNLSYKSEDTSETSTSFDIYDSVGGHNYESIDFISSFNGQIKIKNDFDLRNFPFDKQRIVFNFSETKDVDVYINAADSVYSNLDMLMNEKLINGWKLVDYRVTGENYQEQRFYENIYLNSLKIILEIERESSYYVYKIILPIVLILMVCWSVMWITPKELEARLTVTIVCLLSLIAYNFVIDSEIPKLEYLTIMDWIIFASYIFATIPNFLCIISHKLYRKNKNLCMRIEEKAKYFGPISYVAIILLIISYNINLEPDHSVQALKVLAK
tara:strand:- start:2716 stop:4305 length:1590 start_codon:yes stop_codon:yes gene_type:complete